MKIICKKRMTYKSNRSNSLQLSEILFFYEAKASKGKKNGDILEN
jgi:hypothetical protein